MFRVMKIAEYSNAVFYKADCACSDNTDIITIELELISNDFGISQTLYYNKKHYSFLDRLKILFTGKTPYEPSFIFDSKEQIKSYIKALQEGVEYLEGARGIDLTDGQYRNDA